jgi:hypothetical protein
MECKCSSTENDPYQSEIGKLSDSKGYHSIVYELLPELIKPLLSYSGFLVLPNIDESFGYGSPEILIK